MDYDHELHSMTFVSGFVLGAMVGAGIALLAAPEAGMKTRRRIRRVAGELRDSARRSLGRPGRRRQGQGGRRPCGVPASAFWSTGTPNEETDRLLRRNSKQAEIVRVAILRRLGPRKEHLEDLLLLRAPLRGEFSGGTVDEPRHQARPELPMALGLEASVPAIPGSRASGSP